MTSATTLSKHSRILRAGQGRVFAEGTQCNPSPGPILLSERSQASSLLWGAKKFTSPSQEGGLPRTEASLCAAGQGRDSLASPRAQVPGPFPTAVARNRNRSRPQSEVRHRPSFPAASSPRCHQVPGEREGAQTEGHCSLGTLARHLRSDSWHAKTATSYTLPFAVLT